MIPPLSAEPGLATSINREPDTQTQALGMPRSAPIESTRAAAPNEQPDNPNTNENTNLSQGSLRLSADATNRPGNGLLNTLEDAKAALNKVLEQFNQSPNTSMQAQRADSGAVAALMQPA